MKDGIRATRVAAFLVLAAVGCVRSDEGIDALVDQVGAERLADEAQTLCPPDLVSQHSVVDETLWPPTIRRLDPQSVWLAQQGVYIKLRSPFVEESGIFVPYNDASAGRPVDVCSNSRDGTSRTRPSFRPDVGSDPSYRRVASRVYHYRIKG